LGCEETKKNAMKVLVLSHYDDVVSARPEAQLILELFRRGVNMEVLTNQESELTRQFVQEGIPVAYWHPSRKICPQGIRRLRTRLREGKFDILHLFNSRSASNGVWAAVGLPLKVVTYRGAGGLYWHDPLAYLSHLHPRVDRISCLSKYIQAQVDRQFFLRRKKTRVHYKAFLPEWFDEIRFGKPEIPGIPDQAIVVGCVANYRKVKGVETLVKSTWQMQRDERLHLVLVGRDMDNPGLQKLIARSPMRQRIHLTGFREDVYNVMHRFQIYVQPSIMEGLSKTVMEAMLLEKPCVVTRAGGMPELFPDKGSGILVGIRDHHAMGAAILNLAGDPGLRESMGKAGRKAILDRFTMESYVNGVLSMYEELMR
jgi:L-malate glycosyltransferase